MMTKITYSPEYKLLLPCPAGKSTPGEYFSDEKIPIYVGDDDCLSCKEKKGNGANYIECSDPASASYSLSDFEIRLALTHLFNL